MAGPLSSEEIEDVVSSVRRLVSNELRPRTLSRDPNSGRLLLTAALRVAPASGPLAPLVLDTPVIEASADRKDMPGNLPAGAPLHGDSLVPVPGEAPGDGVVAPATDPADAVAAIEPDMAPVRPYPGDARRPAVERPAEGPGGVTAAEGAGQGELPKVGEPVWEIGLRSEAVSASLGGVGLAAEAAEVLIGSTGGDERPAVGEEGAEAAPPCDGHPAEAAETEPDEPIPFAPVHRRAEHKAASPAAVEAAPHEESGQPAGAAAHAALPGPEPAEFVDVDGMALAVLDEAALQEIVRQTLRAELQGELGERITRNIRKLVRAEINRAFLARDLD